METVHKPRKQGQSKSFKEGIVLHKYKVIYFQIPKVACSSIKHVLAHFLEFSEKETEFIHLVDFPSIGKEECTSGVYKRYYRFAFARNPWDRLWSCYCSKVATKKRNVGFRFENGIHRSFLKYKSIEAGMSFDEFSRAVQNIPDDQSDPHFKSQHTFITGKDGKLLVDFIGHFENLQDDFRSVCRKTGLPERPLPQKNSRYPKHCNKEFTQHYSHYYSEEAKQIVSDRFRKDIELLGYRILKRSNSAVG